MGQRHSHLFLKTKQNIAALLSDVGDGTGFHAQGVAREATIAILVQYKVRI